MSHSVRGARCATARRQVAALALVVLGLALVSCAAVRARRAEPEPSGFLGDYSQLAPVEGYGARLLYIAPNVDWSVYQAILIDSVTIWADEDSGSVPERDRQMLTDLAYSALHRELGRRFELVERPGPEVLRLRAALTQAKAAIVPLRTITSVVPTAFLISTAAGLSTDTAGTVGRATIEVDVVDAITGRRLAAGMDSRAGTKSILAGARTFKTWGDVEAACSFWAERVAEFLARQGVPERSGG